MTDTDEKILRELNDRFIEACREGNWPKLEPILTRDFRHLDGGTGESWGFPRYSDDMDEPAPGLDIDQVVVHVAGDAATVSARAFRRPADGGEPARYNRYVDSYVRSGDTWVCYHACVWPLQ